MRRLLTPLTLAATGGALLVGAAGGAVAASAAGNPAPKPVAPILGACVDQAAKDGKLSAAQAKRIHSRLDLRQELRDAFKAERKTEHTKRLDPSKRQEIAKPILDKAGAKEKLPKKAAARIYGGGGKANSPGPNPNPQPPTPHPLPAPPLHRAGREDMRS